MKRTRTILSLLLALMMLLGSANGVFAKGSSEAETPAEKTETQEELQLKERETGAVTAAQKGDVYWDPIHTVTLTEAANPYLALNQVPIADTSTWITKRDTDMERVVASAPISAASGTYSETLVTETMDLCLGNSYMSWSAYVSTDNGASLTVRCTNVDTGATWTPFAYSFVNGTWYNYSCTLSAGTSGISYSANYNVKVEFIYTYTVGSKGGDDDSGPSCMITDLQIVDTSSMDSVLNYYDSDLHFEPAADNGVDPFCSYAYPYVARSFVRLNGLSGEDVTSAVTAHVVAAKDDVLSFDYVSSLNYMSGANFLFGLGTSADDMTVLYSGENEGGDGSLWNDWVTWEYTIPANGEYDFIWVLETWDSDDSNVYLDNVRMTPRMSRERVLELDYLPCSATYTDGDDTPWYPVCFNGEFCMRSGNITHSQTSTMLSEHNLLKEGDMYEYRLWMSSEQDFDKLKLYLIDELTGEVYAGVEESGIFDGWVAYGTPVQKDGLYTVKFVYEKDSSVSKGDDCAYIDFVVIPDMTLTNAVAYDEHTEENLNAWDYYYEDEYHFVPAMYNDEIVLVSDNNGVPSSSAMVCFTAQLQKNDVFSFEYIKDAEANWDNLTISSDIESVTIKPRSTDWQTYSVIAPETREYQFSVTFSKDDSVNVGTDSAYLRNVRIAAYDSLFNEALQLDYQGDDYLFQYENGGFEIVRDGDIDCVALTTSDAAVDAAIGARYEAVAFDYVTFKYKVEGAASLQFVVANHVTETQELQYTEDGEWQQFYYRIPKSYSDWLFVMHAASNGGTVYIDDFYIGTLDMDLEEAMTPSGAEVLNINYADSYGFEGVSDPLEPRGQTTYARSRIENGQDAELFWTAFMDPGDYVYISIHFYEEELGSTDSMFQIYVDGELRAEHQADWLNNEYWYLINYSEDYSGYYEFELRYESYAEAPGDAFAVRSGVVRSGTLDDALNVEGGAIDFYYEEGVGNFIPRISGDRAYAIPNAEILTEEVNEYYCDFEAADSMDGWVLVDSDGDGYNWRRLDVLNSDIHSNPLIEAYVLCSDDYTMLPDAEELDLTPDDWALTPELTLPEGSGGFTVDFYFAASAPAYQGEEFSVYVGTGTDVNTYTFVKHYVMTDGDWDYDAIYIDRSMFDGDTVRLAFRHQYNGGVTGVMIDELTMTTSICLRSEVSFDLSVSAGDTIAFELFCNGSDLLYHQGREIILYAEGYGELIRIDAYEFASEHGLKTWTPVSVTVPFSGQITFRIIEEGPSAIRSGLNVYLDNVEHIRTGSSLPGDVNCDGEVNFLDVSALYLFLLGQYELTDEGIANADFNGDGEVNFLDISEMNLFLLG